MTVGDRIRQRRKELGLSQEELANRLGNKSRASVCTVETGKEDLTMDRIRKYAEALECEPGYLTGWISEEEAHTRLLNAYYQRLMKMSITEREISLIASYRAASQEVQGVIDKILGMER